MHTISEKAYKISSKWNQEGTKCKFSERTRPELPYLDYLKRLHRLLKCGMESFDVMLIYLERIPTTYQLDNVSLYTLSLISLVLAIKYLEDKTQPNRFYSKVGGLDLRTFNELEIELLEMLDYDIHIKIFLENI